jgi:hypothetical protein
MAVVLYPGPKERKKKERKEEKGAYEVCLLTTE